MNLFSDEMKYLHDNGFKVIKISDLGYSQSNNYLYIKEPITNNNDNTALLKIAKGDDDT